MLKKLLLRNFQKHKKLEIKLDKKVTTIVGPTDSGKSSVIRALRWLVTNNPTGDAFKRDGAEVVTVGLKLDDGKTIMRQKSSSKNTMILGEKEFKAFGTGVPEEVSAAINLSEVNFQDQHDPPFWFSQTAGQVSRELNAIVNLDIVDETMKNLAGELRKSKVKLEMSKEDLEEAEVELKGLDYVDELSKEFQALEKLEKEMGVGAREYDSLRLVIEKVLRVQDSFETLILARRDGLRACVAGGLWADKLREADALDSLIKRVSKLNEEASVELPTRGEIEVLRKYHDDWLDGKEEADDVEEMIGIIVAREKKWKKACREALAAKEELDDKSEGICPLCGGEMK